MALLATSAVVLGGSTSIVVPAGAQERDPRCDTPGAVVQDDGTTVLPDGTVLDCPAPQATPGDGGVSAGGGQPSGGGGGGETPASGGGTTTSGGGSATSGGGGSQSSGGGSTQGGDGGSSSPKSGGGSTSSKPAAAYTRPDSPSGRDGGDDDADGTTQRASGDGDGAGARRGGKGGPRTGGAKKGKGGDGHGHELAEHGDETHGEVGSSGDADAAATYAALPSAWKSLTPIILPGYGVGEFPIPPFLLPLYQAAGAEYGIPWQVLASINEIETDFGRNATVSSAGALGWMQFIPSSWEEWGVDGDGDRRRDPRNPVDAIFAAANYLADAGAEEDLPRAVFAYNHADWYVNRVIERAREFASLDPEVVASLTERALRENTGFYRFDKAPVTGDAAPELGAGSAFLLSKAELQEVLLEGDAAEYQSCTADDIDAGRIDRRVMATLVYLAWSDLKPTVSSFQCNHGLMTASGNVSAHSYGHAVDVAALNGTSIMGNQGKGSITEKALELLQLQQGYLRPNQVITLMTVDGHDNFLSMGDHADHIHIGFPRVAKAPDDKRPDDVKALAERFEDLPGLDAAKATARRNADLSR